MQLHVRSQARALDCVCSIISSRLHVRVKTYVYRVLWCKSCEAWHEVLFLLLLCARRWSRFGRITNFKIVFLILSIRPEHSLRFNRETLRFKWIKLYISNTHLTRLSDFTRFTSRGEYSNRESDFCAVKEISMPSKSVIDLLVLPTLSSRRSIATRLSEAKKIISLIPESRAVSSFRDRWQGWKVATKRSVLSRAYRTLAAARAAVDVLRTRKMRKSERSGREEGDNEIEMAKADHRIGWLNGGWRSRSRRTRTRTRGLIRVATALSARASPAPRN